LGVDGFIQLVTVIAIFVFVLVITYFTTRFVGGYAKSKVITGNIELIDSMKIAPSGYIAVVRVASKYIAVGIGKNEISFLCELPGEDVMIRDAGGVAGYDFKELIEKARGKIGKK
jgi:flagellar protein FliO/FliZ